MRTPQDEKYGFISGLLPEHKDRIHLDGVGVSSGPEVFLLPDDDGQLYVVFQLDPCSPLGSMICKHVVPITPAEDFHFDRASFWIYLVAPDMVRCELRVQVKTRFGQKNPTHVEEIYGFQAPARDVAGVRDRTSEKAVQAEARAETEAAAE